MEIRRHKGITTLIDCPKFFQKIFRKPMAEGMRINNIGINLITDGKVLKLTRNPSGTYPPSLFIQKQKTTGSFFIL